MQAGSAAARGRIGRQAGNAGRQAGRQASKLAGICLGCTVVVFRIQISRSLELASVRSFARPACMRACVRGA